MRMGKSKKEQTRFVKIKQESAEQFIKLLKTKLSNELFIDRRKKIKHEGVYVFFPLIDDVEKIKALIGGISNQLNFDIVSAEGIAEANYKFRSIEDALVGELPENILELVPKSYDIIGKIAIVEFDQLNTIIDKNVLSYKKKVA